jgi:hypothetical protein
VVFGLPLWPNPPTKVEPPSYQAYLGRETLPLETCVVTGMLRDMTRDLQGKGYKVTLGMRHPHEGVTDFYIPGLDAATAAEVCHWVKNQWGYYKCDVEQELRGL